MKTLNTAFCTLVIGLVTTFNCYAEQSPYQVDESPIVSCRNVVNSSVNVSRGDESWWRNSEEFTYRDSLYGFEFTAFLRRATLVVDMNMKNLEKSVRSRFRASDLFQLALEHIGPNNALDIELNWAYGDNHQEFFKYLEQGLSSNEAALATWSGQLMIHLGYSHVKNISFSFNSRSRKNDKVTVHFKRPYFLPADNFEKQKYEGLSQVQETFRIGSSNRLHYFTLRASGYSPKEAAKFTQFGTKISELGFTETIKVEEIWVPNNQNEIEAALEGGHHEVRVIFRKPSNSNFRWGKSE